MTCKSVHNRMSAYLDGELDGKEMLAIRDHLGACPECREEAQTMRMLKRMLSASPTPEPPADLADRLCASVLAHHRSTEDADGASRSSFRTAAVTFAGVALCSMALTFTVLSNVRPVGEKSNAEMASKKAVQDVAFDLQRDQVYAAGLDVTDGVPFLANPSSGRR